MAQPSLVSGCPHGGRGGGAVDHQAGPFDAAPMADVVSQCAAREVRTPTQYVARWAETACGLGRRRR